MTFVREPAADVDAAEALAAAAGAGPYFAVEPWAEDAGWQPASLLVSDQAVLGAAVLGGVVPYLTLDHLWWRPVDGGPVPLAAGPVTGREIGDAAAGRPLDDAAALLSGRWSGHGRSGRRCFPGLVPALTAGAAGQPGGRAGGRRRDAAGASRRAETPAS